MQMAKWIVLPLALLGLAYLFFKGGNVITGAEARRLVEAGALLVDVRTTEEFAVGHIAGALNIPVQGLEKRMRELDPKDRPIVLYCRSGNRSARALRLLQEAGFSHVYDLGAQSRW